VKVRSNKRFQPTRLRRAADARRLVPQITMRTFLLLAVLSIAAGCALGGGGPAPRAVFVIASTQHPLEKVLAALDAVYAIRIDKKKETITLSDKKEIPRFSHFEVAYWYPLDGSDVYGVALVKWRSDLKGEGADEMKDRLFVDVYATDKGCALCSTTREALKAHGISFRSPCESPESSTKYEQIRCGT